MKHRIASLLVPFVLACAATDDGDDPTTTTASTSGTTASASSNPGDDGAATTMTGAGATTDAASSGGEAEGSSGAASSSGDGGGSGDGGSTGGSDSGGVDLCAPLPADDDCVACAKQQCCDLYAACYGDPDCACAVDCILETGDYATCLGPQCNMPDPTPAMDIGLCYGTTCAEACGF